jgi:hypothetical protein
MHFLSSRKLTLLLEIHFRNEVLGTFLSLTNMLLVHRKAPGKTLSLAMWPLGVGAARLRPIPARPAALPAV